MRFYPDFSPKFQGKHRSKSDLFIYYTDMDGLAQVDFPDELH